MQKNWTVNKIKVLKELKNKYKDEQALSRYIGCMIRIVNGMAQMYYSQFHYYEKTILWEAMEIFTRQFIQEIEKAGKESDAHEKRKLVDDIEDAVKQMTEVYQNTINSTANSDRQMLSGISVDTSIYELSPKLCAFYSRILSDLMSIFKEEEEGEYAFVLHPTLKNNTETKILFDRREEAGRVVIIYISESIIEEINVVPVFILHELFHVVTKERLRRQRLGYYVEMMMSATNSLLLSKVQISSDIEKDTKYKEIITKKFFSTMEDEGNKWKKIKSEKHFYGNNVIVWAENYFSNRLQDIYENIEGWIAKEYDLWEFEYNSYEEFRSEYSKRNKAVNQIQKNIFNIVTNYQITRLAEQFMFICREIYADLACIILLDLKPEFYENAFERSRQFAFDNTNFRDSVQEIRNYVVRSVVVNYLSDSVAAKWKEYYRNINIYIYNRRAYENNRLTNDQSDGIILLTHVIESALIDYADECANAFYTKLKNKSYVTVFRENLHSILYDDNEAILVQIMIGDFDKLFSKKY